MPGMQKVPRHLYLYFEQGDGPVDTVQVFYDFLSTAAYTTTNLSLTSSIDGSRETIIKRIDLGGECEFFSLRLTADSRFVFLGYEVLFRPKRRIRRAE